MPPLCPFQQVERALAVASERASAAGAPIYEFLHVDATVIEDSTLAGRTFDVLLEGGVYHNMEGEKRDQCVAAQLPMLFVSPWAHMSSSRLWIFV